MSRMIDLTGKIFERLTVIKWVGTRNRRPVWRCKCSCGKKADVLGENLRYGQTRSCGCLRGERHGRAKSTEWNVWVDIRRRCEDENRPDYARYGGRGIKICKRWQSFIAFFEDMGECPAGYSIDRIDNNDGYHPENCRWATAKEQANNRRSSRWIEYNGMRKTLMQWSECTGIKRTTIAARLDRGLSAWQALGKDQACE